jgi:preprotein translocase subunit SecA
MWVKNAFVAKNHARAKDSYVLADVSGKGDQVVIVDKDTGVEQIQMQWSHGLHQFLQLKHGDNLYPESLKAVFISNLGYFQRYPGKIYGVSGTLGTETERKILGQMYHLETFTMPRFKTRFCIEKDSVVVQPDQWLAAIAKNVKQLTSVDRRAVLVICENIESVDIVAAELHKNQISNDQVYLYKSALDTVFQDRNNKHPMASGDVVVATNLAGRGTDLKISEEVERLGGLHVIITFMPQNVRLELQAEGRTARAGSSGSFQFIIADDPSMTLDSIRKARDEDETQRLEKVRQTSFIRLKIEEELFKRFQAFHLEVKEVLKEDQLQLEFLLNRWALWLDEADYELDRLNDERGKELYYIKFDEFQRNIRRLLHENTGIKLAAFPTELNKLGHYFESSGKLSLAMQCYDKSINLSKQHCEVALYYRAATYLRNSSSLENKQKAFADLKKSAALIQRRIGNLIGSVEGLKLVNSTRRDAGEGVNHGRYEKTSAESHSSISDSH